MASLTFKKRVRLPTVDEIALYLAKGCVIYPPLDDHFLDELTELERRGKLSLTPSLIFLLYHRDLHRKINEKYRRAA